MDERIISSVGTSPQRERQQVGLDRQRAGEVILKLFRSDNDVKNHFHSKLRRAIRKINLLISCYLRNEFKPLKNNIISKILQTTEEAQDHELPEFQTIYRLGQGIHPSYTRPQKQNSGLSDHFRIGHLNGPIFFQSNA